MFSVIFEVHPNDGKKDDYLELAKHLKPRLETIDGFVDNERFESKLRPGWVLSHSTWRDEKSVVRWRTEGRHHEVQERGRFEIFEDYHLRVGEIVRDTSPPPGIPVIEQRLDESEAGEATHATLTEIMPQNGAAFDPKTLPALLGVGSDTNGVVKHEVYKSISAIYPDDRTYLPGKLALLLSWTTAASAEAWTPQQMANAQ